MFYCSGRCPERLESAREALEIEFGGLNSLLSFPLRTTPLFLQERFCVKAVFRPPKSISGASRADSSGSGHLPEQENTMGDSGSDAGASIHASFRPLHRAAAGSLRTIYKKRLFSSSRPSTQLSGSVPTGSITSHTPLINPAPRVRVIHSHVVARARRCGRAPR